MKTQVETRVKETVTLEVERSKKTTKEQLLAFLKKQVSDMKKKVEDVDVKLNGTSSLVGEVDQKISNLTDRVEKLEKITGRPIFGRRTLANGGKES